MPENIPNDNTKEIKALVVGIRDALIVIRDLFIRLISFAIVLGEKVRESLRKSQEKRRKDKLKSQENPLPTRTLPKSTLTKSTLTKSTLPKHPLPKENSSEGSNLLIQKNKSKTFIRDLSYPVLAAISTFALVIGVGRLGPISKWAGTQIDCIESNSLVTETDKTNLAKKVMVCNGGHD